MSVGTYRWKRFEGKEKLQETRGGCAIPLDGWEDACDRGGRMMGEGRRWVGWSLELESVALGQAGACHQAKTQSDGPVTQPSVPTSRSSISGGADD